MLFRSVVRLSCMHYPIDVLLTTFPGRMHFVYYLATHSAIYGLIHQSCILYHVNKCMFADLIRLFETEEEVIKAVAGPTPRMGSLLQTVQSLIGTFYRGDPLLLAGRIFPSTDLALEGGPWHPPSIQQTFHHNLPTGRS